jgi:hypothetical protein
MDGIFVVGTANITTALIMTASAIETTTTIVTITKVITIWVVVASLLNGALQLSAKRGETAKRQTILGFTAITTRVVALTAFLNATTVFAVLIARIIL